MAFAVTQRLSRDIDRGYFDWIYQTTEYTCWRKGKSSWQLRCVGGPGSGKTTLSALLNQRLVEGAKAGGLPVASIFIQRSPIDGEDVPHQFVLSLLDQYSKFARDRTHRDGLAHRPPTDTAKLREDLSLLLRHIGPTFLIVDDIDACGFSTALKLETELHALQKQDVRILVTSRIGLCRTTLVWDCDNPTCASESSELIAWWRCNVCQQGLDNYVQCHECRMKELPCNICGSIDNFVQPYLRLELDIENSSHFAPPPVGDFVAREIQNCHGDLRYFQKLDVDDSKWPPLSRFGEQLTGDIDDMEASTNSSRLRDYIVSSAYGNITLAKLRVESISDAHSIEQVLARQDRLPRPVIVLFDMLVAEVEKSELGIFALRLVLTAADGKVELADFQRQVGMWSKKHLERAYVSLLEVLYAARGLLAAKVLYQGQIAHVFVAAYNGDFLLYLKDGYHEGLRADESDGDTADC